MNSSGLLYAALIVLWAVGVVAIVCAVMRLDSFLLLVGALAVMGGTLVTYAIHRTNGGR